MRHQKERGAELASKLEDQFHDMLAVGLVQVAGGFVGQENGRLGDDGTCERGTLLLAAGHLAGIVVDAMGKSHLGQRSRGPGQRVAPAHQLERYGDVLKRGQRRDQVEGLEQDREAAAPKPRKSVLVQAADIDAVDHHSTAGGTLDAGDHRDQARLAGTGRTHHAYRSPWRDLEIDALEDRDPPGRAHQLQTEVHEIDHPILTRRSFQADGRYGWPRQPDQTQSDRRDAPVPAADPTRFRRCSTDEHLGRGHKHPGCGRCAGKPAVQDRRVG